MALDNTTLSKVAQGRNQLFIYTTADDAATVTASGYFNDATNELKQYDVIVLIDTTNSKIDLLFVTSATGASTVTTSAVEGVTTS